MYDNNRLFWKDLILGQRIKLGFLKVDRAGTTKEWQTDLPIKIINQRCDLFYTIIESISNRYDTAPFQIQGDGTMLFFHDTQDSVSVNSAFYAAQEMRQSFISNSIDFRISINHGVLKWNNDTGRIRNQSLDHCGHLEHVTPLNSISITDDAFLSLPDTIKNDFYSLGFTKRDNIPAWVYPTDIFQNTLSTDFTDRSILKMLHNFRKYSLSPEISKLKYSGFRLSKKEPPSLDVDKVYIPSYLIPLSTKTNKQELNQDIDLNTDNAFSGDKFTELPFSSASYLSSNLVTFSDIFQNNRYLLLLGEPGIGKTTLVRWLSHYAAKGKWSLFNSVSCSESLIPIPVSVGILSYIRTMRLQNLSSLKPVSVIECLVDYFHDRNLGIKEDIQTFLVKYLEKGECLVLFDGLDEVPMQIISDIRTWIESFITIYDNNRYIITSRRVNFTGFNFPTSSTTNTPYVIQPFSRKQIEKFIDFFCNEYDIWENNGILDVNRVTSVKKALINAIDLKRLHGLVHNPFLLSGIALIHRSEGNLPQYRVQFYDIFARCLCDSWSRARRLIDSELLSIVQEKKTYDSEAKIILGYLGLKMQEFFPTGIAPDSFVNNTIVDALVKYQQIDPIHAKSIAPKLLESLCDDNQLLQKRGANSYGFLHLTFQEFFAAVGLHATELFQTFFENNWYNPRWEEVIRLGLGYLEIIQGRPLANEKLISTLLNNYTNCHKIVIALKLNIPLSFLFASESPSTVLHKSIVSVFIDWLMYFGINEMSYRILEEVGYTELGANLSESLLALLCSDNPHVSELAFNALSILKSEACIESLLKFLHNNNLLIVIRSIILLGEIKSERSVEPLIKILKSKSSVVSSLSSHSLGNINSVSAITHLIKLLDHSDVDIRKNVIIALTETKSILTEKIFIELLNDPSHNIRAKAAYALGEMCSLASTNALKALLNDSDFDVRCSATIALGKIKSPDCIEQLLLLRNDSEQLVRLRASEALIMINNDQITPHLLNGLMNASTNEIIFYIHVIGGMKVLACAPHLHELLFNVDVSVRRETASALGQIRISDSIPFLILSLKDSDYIVRITSASILGEMKAEMSMQSLFSLLSDSNDVVRTKAAIALHKISNATPINIFHSLLDDDCETVRCIAASIIGDMHNIESICTLKRHLHKSYSSPSFRRNLFLAIIKIDPKNQIEFIIEHLKHYDKDTILHYILPYTNILSDAFINPIIDIINNCDISVRIDAFNALVRLLPGSVVY